jgi:hypothetical protein
MNKNNAEIGITDEIQNPFAKNRSSWIEQDFGLTEHRRAQLLRLLNLSVGEIIDNISENESLYVGFIAVRWGFAKVEEGKLMATEKLVNLGMYDERGQLK